MPLVAKVINEAGTVVGELALEPSVFSVPLRPTVMHEAVVAEQANRRVIAGHTKTRGEVRGGGKKPWKQKGTGRARHGSSRSPIWIGGGITHGPRPERNYGHRINRKKKALAIRMALSEKVVAGGLHVLDSFTLTEYKTKRVATLLKTLNLGSRSLLFLLPGASGETGASARNIRTVQVRSAGNVNLTDIIKARELLTTKAGVERLVEQFKPRK